MKALIKAAHSFLQNFCLGNPENQTLLHSQLDVRHGIFKVFLCPLTAVSRDSYSSLASLDFLDILG